MAQVRLHSFQYRGLYHRQRVRPGREHMHGRSPALGYIVGETLLVCFLDSEFVSCACSWTQKVVLLALDRTWLR